MPQENAQTLETFKTGHDRRRLGARALGHPPASRRAAARSSSTRRRCGPAAQFVTTHLIVRTEFLKEHPDVVKRLLEGHVAATDFVNANPAEAKTAGQPGHRRS